MALKTGLIRTFLRANLSGHWSTLPNLVAGALGMIVNNCIFLAGMWGMLFAGKPENSGMLVYYIGLNALFMIAWGGLNFFAGGFMDLGELITSGQFESKLSMPRHPLLLVGFHALHPSALGDFAMGIVGAGIVGWIAGPGMAVRVFLAAGLTVSAIFGLFVLSGSAAFFVPRGNHLAQLFREVTISLSVYPLERIFPVGLGRILLLLTPAGMVTLLPMHWVESAGWRDFSVAVGADAFFVALAARRLRPWRKTLPSARRGGHAVTVFAHRADVSSPDRRNSAYPGIVFLIRVPAPCDRVHAYGSHPVRIPDDGDTNALGFGVPACPQPLRVHGRDTSRASSFLE